MVFVVAGKYVDYQGFRFSHDYKDKLKERLTGVANVGKWGPFMNYHSVPELEITGGRNNEERIKKLHLDEIDFKGKTVLDIGCSEGFFCRYAMDRGAKRVVGLDLPGVVKPTRELAYYLGYNNIDFYGYDLKKEIPDLGKFDIVLFLSMVHHIGLPDWILDSTKKLLVFEGNGKSEDAGAISKLNGKLIDKTVDLFERPVVWKKK
jgi:2-polyprenyl-3-methyl-5-hydroxy-6-metoxy-1,4-benzoquinol methylase